MAGEAGIDTGELRDLVRDVLRDHPGPIERIPGEDGFGFDRALWTQMAELGWLALGIGEGEGGLGLGLSHLAVVHEELGRALAAVPFAETAMAAGLVEEHGTAHARARLLPAIAAGDAVATLALDTVPLALAGGRLSGRVEALPFASDADLLLVPAGDGGIAVVAADADGVTVEDRPLVDLTRRMGSVAFADVAVGPDELLRPLAAAWERLRDHAAIAVACDAIGGAAEVLERTIAYMGLREQFGRPIGSFQALKHRVATWKVKLDGAVALVRHAADAVSVAGDDSSALASAAKFTACETYAAIAGDAVQLHGGIGFTWEHPCHLFLKRAKLDQQLAGGSTFHKERVARLAFAAPSAILEGHAA